MRYSFNLLFPKGKEDEMLYKTHLPDEFIKDLNLNQIAENILPENPDYVITIFRKMYEDEEIIKYRQDILEDVLNLPELESVLFEIISRINYFDRTIGSKTRNAQSFIDIGLRLQGLKTYIKSITECYEFAKNNEVRSEGLKGLMSEIIRIYESDDFKVLEREVKNLEDTLSEVRSITIGINFDEIKQPYQMAILSFSDKPFKQKTLLSRIFNKDLNENEIEPVGIFHTDDKYNNATGLHSALFNDLIKVNKDILNHFSIALNRYYKFNIQFFLELSKQLHFYLGCKRLIKRLMRYGIKFCKPVIESKEARIFDVEGMVDMSFAIKLMNSKPDEYIGNIIVPNDITMGDNGRIFILTGPNNSGKTTYTRAAGICQVLVQAGLFVPGTSANISVTDWIYTHFPKEEVVGINTSRLTQECKQLKTTFTHATKYSLILSNESFQSTTYSESMFIAAGFIKLCRQRGCRAIYTTHLIDLALHIDEYEKEVKGDSKIVSMVSVVKDTAESIDGSIISYKIKPGPPYKHSYAHEILEKYGIDFENMMVYEDDDKEDIYDNAEVLQCHR